MNAVKLRQQWQRKCFKWEVKAKGSGEEVAAKQIRVEKIEAIKESKGIYK